jgi:hypothetical protein
MAEGDARRVIGEFTSYDEMVAAVRARVAELNVAGEALDEYAGLPRGYLSKLVGARPVRRISHVSMGPVLNGLGLKGQFVEDPVATALLKKRLPPRNNSFVRSVAVHGHLTTRFLAKIGRKGGQHSRKYLGKRMVKQLARKAAAARWGKLNP